MPSTGFHCASSHSCSVSLSLYLSFSQMSNELEKYLKIVRIEKNQYACDSAAVATVQRNSTFVGRACPCMRVCDFVILGATTAPRSHNLNRGQYQCNTWMTTTSDAYINRVVKPITAAERKRASKRMDTNFIHETLKNLVQTRFRIPIPSVYNFFLAYVHCSVFAFCFVFYDIAAIVISVADMGSGSSETGEIPNISLNSYTVCLSSSSRILIQRCHRIHLNMYIFSLWIFTVCSSSPPFMKICHNINGNCVTMFAENAHPVAKMSKPLAHVKN